MASTLLAVPFIIERKALLAATQTEVIAPRTCQSCTVSNATTGDLRIITDEAGVGYRVVASNFEWVIWLPRVDSPMFRRGQLAFWLQADDAGDAVLTWA